MQRGAEMILRKKLIKLLKYVFRKRESNLGQCPGRAAVSYDLSLPSAIASGQAN